MENILVQASEHTSCSKTYVYIGMKIYIYMKQQSEEGIRVIFNILHISCLTHMHRVERSFERSLFGIPHNFLLIFNKY